LAHRFTAEGKLLSFRVAGSSRFKREDIERWVQEQKKNKEWLLA
jgi:hypothetical protein